MIIMAEMIALQMCNSTNTPKFTFAGEIRHAKCVHVYDGDTAHFAFCPFSGVAPHKFSVRMYGYNSAEMNSSDPVEKEAAQRAKGALSELIQSRIVSLHLYDFDKYGRPLADVFVDVDGTQLHVNKWMVEHCFGKPYFGEGEKRW